MCVFFFSFETEEKYFPSLKCGLAGGFFVVGNAIPPNEIPRCIARCCFTEWWNLYGNFQLHSWCVYYRFSWYCIFPPPDLCPPLTQCRRNAPPMVWTDGQWGRKIVYGKVPTVPNPRLCLPARQNKAIEMHRTDKSAMHLRRAVWVVGANQCQKSRAQSRSLQLEPPSPYIASFTFNA